MLEDSEEYSSGDEKEKKLTQIIVTEEGPAPKFRAIYQAKQSLAMRVIASRRVHRS